jgi:protease I
MVMNPITSVTVLAITIFVGTAPMTTQAQTRSAFDDILATEGTAMVPRVSTAMILAQQENRALRELLTSLPKDAQEFRGKRIAVVTADGVEEIELKATLRYFRDRGAQVDIIAPPKPAFPDQYGVQMPAIRSTHILTIRHMENAGWVKFDKLIGEVDASNYEAVIIPGGAWNPDSLRADPAVLAFVQAMSSKNAVVASLCHGPWVLGDAGLLRGKRATAWFAMKRDIEGAGATYVDEPVVIDGRLITPRGPVDLAHFLTAIGKALHTR